MQHNQPQTQLPAQKLHKLPEEIFHQLPLSEQQRQQQDGSLHNSLSHSISRRSPNRLPQTMVASGSSSAQSFAKFGFQHQQPQASRGVLPQSQQVHQRLGSHHLALPRIAMQQQQTRNSALGNTPSGSGHTGSLSTEVLAQSGRITSTTADFVGQSPPQPPSSLPVGTKTNQSRATQVQQDSLVGQPSNTIANSSVDAAQRDKAAESSCLVTVNDRKVKLAADSDSMSLYALCRRWVRNDVLRKDQVGLQNFAKLLPKPLPTIKMEDENFAFQDKQNKNGSELAPSLENFYEGKVEIPSEDTLLENHIKHFRNVRKRSREQHKQRIERYKLRLALLLQPSACQNKVDASLYF